MKQVLFLFFSIILSVNLFSQCPALFIESNSTNVCAPSKNWNEITVGLPLGSSIGVVSISGLGTFSTNGQTTLSTSNLPNGGSIHLPDIDWTGIGTATITVTIYDSQGINVLGCGSININLHGVVNVPLIFVVSYRNITQCQGLQCSGGFDNYQWYKNGGIINGATGVILHDCSVGAYDCFSNSYTIVASGACLVTQSYTANAR